MAYLIDLAGFRIRAKIPTEITDAMLTGLLEGIEQKIETYLGYAPQSQSYTKFYDGNTTNPAILVLLPFTTAITDVWENTRGYYQAGNFTSSELLTAGTDYALANVGNLTPGLLQRLNAFWPLAWRRAATRVAVEIGAALGSVRVQFTAGLNAARMAQVIEAGYLEAAAHRATWLTGYGIQTSASLDGYSLSINPLMFPRGQGLPPFLSAPAEQILRRLRKIPVA